MDYFLLYLGKVFDCALMLGSWYGFCLLVKQTVHLVNTEYNKKENKK